ncbi:MAG TPA: sterol desaturase family protein [Anaeromyxobacteraceae bacterium]|nr:sterol desaturase family protein [Anaeromyxobacteraceae bacterium]
MPVRNYIALAIPFFLVAMGVELGAARARRRSVYRLGDALADLGCGIGQQVVLVFAGALLLEGYAWVHDHAGLVTWRSAAVPWVVAFVWVDFAYYWWHRLSHEVNVLWAGHVVHHQSEDYNLAVALRQSILTSYTVWPFYLPLALVGVPTVVYAAAVSFSTLYQFWIHTELVGKLGRAEAVLNTPSHHRVHHAVNPRYLDRNYGAISIVWDRLFGTFVEEREAPVYGTTRPIGSFNPAWAQVHGLVEIARKARALPRRRDRLRMWFASPGWNPAGGPPPTEAELRARARYDVPLPLALRAYAALHFAPLIAATFLMLLWQYTAPRAPMAAAGVLVAWTLVSVGALLDGKRWGVAAEMGRLVALGVAVVAWKPLGLGGAALGAMAVVVVVGSGAWLLSAVSPRANVTSA